MFIENIFNDLQYFIYWITIIITSVCFHEFCHALAAYWQGDSTGKDNGFFTINPMMQMGATSLIMLIFTGICWGACPVNPNRFKHKYSDVLVSMAGPFANFILAVAFAILTAIMYNVNSDHIVCYNLTKLFWYGCFANVALTMFNIIPLSPLDGHSLVKFIFPKTEAFYEKLGMGGIIILFLIFSIPLFSKTFWGIAYKISNNILIPIFDNLLNIILKLFA